jgi:tRNA pseudouridine38-40 synthase
MKRYFLEVMYEGTAFHGSQLQHELPTVQLALNAALATLLREPVHTFGASRTDEGVHALCNFYHFDTEKELPPTFRYKMNALLPPGIALNRVFLAEDPEANARFSAASRQYRYRIYTFKDPFRLKRAMYHPFRIDWTLLEQAAGVIMEYDNFESFAKRGGQAKTYQCRILESRWERQGREYHYIVRANRFLRGMVRGLVGTQLQVGRGRHSLAEFRAIIEAGDCTRADFSVPGYGLYLEDIRYPEGMLREVSFQ